MHERLSTAGLRFLVAGALAMAASVSLAHASQRAPDEVVPGIVVAQLEPAYWIDRLQDRDRVILDAAAIDAHKARMRRSDPSLFAIEQLPATVDAARVRAWIGHASPRPRATLVDEDGRALGARTLDGLERAMDLRAIPATQPVHYGMVVRRADLRTFPSPMRAFSTPGDLDIDRFQESALFPGTPVAVLHRSRDRRWLFVLSETYAAWVEADAVAVGDKAAIFGYARREPFLVVTDAQARTVYTPERPAVSEVVLDMGVRLPLAAWPPDEPLNGQHPAFGHAVELPVRRADGSLEFAAALLPRSAGVSQGYLPLTPANLLSQAFKFLGERYGWGHRYNARDCSGFVSEIYRSFGLMMPRNTSAQARSPGLDGEALDAGTGRDARLRLLAQAEVGDLVYIPGHVMMVIGRVDGETYVIHDTAGMSLLDADGRLRRYRLNGVAVTPLLPLMSDESTTTVDRITSIRRLRP